MHKTGIKLHFQRDILHILNSPPLRPIFGIDTDRRRYFLPKFTLSSRRSGFTAEWFGLAQSQICICVFKRLA